MASLLLLHFTVALTVASTKALICQNGATYDAVYDRCLCTPHYHGAACQFNFGTDNPCNSNPVTLQDVWAAHRPGNRRKCPSHSEKCLTFSRLPIGWYRLRSPAGNSLAEGCGPSPELDCGSQYPYVVHDLVREDTNSRALFSGKAYRVGDFSNGNCYLSGKNEQTYFPVRKLICSDDLILYFLYPLPENNHYCIGKPLEKQPSGFLPSVVPNNEASSIGFIPNASVPKLELENGKFVCAVREPPVKYKEIEYSFRFLRTDKLGKTIEIKNCKSRIFSYVGATAYCPSYEIIRNHHETVNIYGSTLACEVSMKMARTYDREQKLLSNLHSFTFKYSFSTSEKSEQKTVRLLRPNDTSTLCIDTGSIPVQSGVIRFRVSLSMQRTIPTDRLGVSVLHRSRENKTTHENNTKSGCEFAQYFAEGKRNKICIELVLTNRDPDGRLVFGLSSTEQLSLVKLNISYSCSLIPGISTYDKTLDRAKFELLDSLELKVDLNNVTNQTLNYLHVFSDPYVKPANGTYKDNSVYELVVEPGDLAVFDALRHKMLPYQVQVLIERWKGTESIRDSSVTKQVAIRYSNYIIFVNGSVENAALQYRIIKKTPGSKKIIIASEEDVVGVTIESTSDVVRIKFEFYGTIIYVWRFRTDVSKCIHGFVMSRREMQSLDCTGENRQDKLGNNFVLDVMIVPGFYDTEGNVEGLMYSSEQAANLSRTDLQSDKSLFSSSYVMPEISKFTPLVDFIDLCGCEGESSAGEKCIANVKKVKRTKRSVDQFTCISTPNPVAEYAYFNKSKTVISLSEAKKFCNDFVTIRSKEKRFSIEFCSSAADSMTQFEFVCTRYALTLGNYLFVENVFNSMLGMCQEGLLYNATEITVDNGTAAARVEQELCPNRCSDKGVCLSGSCVCQSGFSGPDCSYETSSLESIPTVISSPRQGPECSSAGCRELLLEVSPILKPFKTVKCKIVEISENMTIEDTFEVTASVMTGNLIECDVSSIHTWLKTSGRIFVVTDVSLQADSWSSKNSIRLLFHQSSCSNKRVKCQLDQWNCQTDGNCGLQEIRPKFVLLISLTIAINLVILLTIAAAFVLIRRRSNGSKKFGSTDLCTKVPELLKLKVSRFNFSKKTSKTAEETKDCSLLSSAV